MSKTKQATKNLKLTQKLLDHIVLHSEDLPAFVTKKSTYVVFSNTDKELNKMNAKLLIEMQAEGKNVIRAEETGDKANPWNFVQV